MGPFKQFWTLPPNSFQSYPEFEEGMEEFQVDKPTEVKDEILPFDNDKKSFEIKHKNEDEKNKGFCH